MHDLSLFRALPEPRGCGEREAGGVYAESGIGPYGFPLEHFMIDPPQPVPAGLDLINKPRIVPRELFTGSQALDEAGQPICDLLMHIGAVYYPFAPDFLEETRRLGASRRIPANLTLSLLSRVSRMVLAHPKAIPANWQLLAPPRRCKKRLPGHDRGSGAQEDLLPRDGSTRPGPCLFKLWEVIPAALSESTQALEGQGPLCLRRIGSTVYQYQPTNEEVTGWSEAFILALPLTGFSLIQYVDGSVNQQAKQKLLEAQGRQGAMHLPFYETPR